MTNNELRAQLHSLESQLSSARKLNGELNQELNTISKGIADAERTLEEYCAKVEQSLSDSRGKLVSSHQQVAEAIRVQAEIDKLYEMNKRIELANKKIRACNDKKYYDFANYRTIRKIVQGIMDNLDLNMVSEATIYKAVEVQHLKTPDYWLTCVLIAVVAWRDDNRALADRALAKAINLDRKQTAVFLMLFNLRMNRNDAAVKWFELYRECEITGRDSRTVLLIFSMLSRSISEEADERTRAGFASFINELLGKCVEAEGYSEQEITGIIVGNFKSMKSSFPADYPLVHKYVTGVERLMYALRFAENNKNILEFVLRTINVPVQEKNRFIKQFVDEMIQAPNDAERAVYEEIEYNELIIRLSGDSERAKAVFGEEINRRENHLNLIKEIVCWIYDRENEDVNPQMRSNMLTLAKNYHIVAAQTYREDYSRGYSVRQSVTINDYTAECDLSAPENEMSRAAEYYRGLRDGELSKIKNWPAYIWFAAGALGIAGGIFLHALLFGVTFGGAVGGTIVLLRNKFRRRAVTNTYSEKTRNTSEIIGKLCGEFARFSAQYSEADGYFARLIEELNKL